MMKYRLKDPVHGIIEFNELEKKIMDSSVFQRLRKIKQLGLANLVYIGASHTRFEHSIGSMHIAGEIAQNLGMDKSLARLCALLHDIGHVSFSHDGETIVKKLYKKSHEDLGKELLKQEFGFLFENYKEKDFFESNESKVSSFSLGADRIDYLKRDALYTGVAYGIIEDDILHASLGIENGKFFVRQSALEAAESFFIGRFMMFFAVYLHKAVRISSIMVQDAVEKGLIEGAITFEDLIWQGDEVVLKKLSDFGIETASLLNSRNLHKKLISLEITKENLAIAEELKKENALVHITPEVGKGYDIFVSMENVLVPIEEASSLVKSLKHAESQKRNILIAVKEGEMKNFEKKLDLLMKK